MKLFSRTYYFLILALAFGLFFTSCEDDKQDPEPASPVIELKTRLFANGQPIQIGDTAMLSNNYEFNLKKFKLYLIDVEVIDDAGVSHRIADVELLDVGDSQTGRLSGTVNPGNYEGLTLGFGVDAELNNSDPTSFPDEHPLSSYQQMYWSMLKYRFAILEGRSNPNGSLGGPDDILHAYHPGTDPLFQRNTYSLNFETSNESTTVLYLDIDIDKIFNTAPLINLTDEPQTHSEPVDINVAQKFMNNLSATAELKLQ